MSIDAAEPAPGLFTRIKQLVSDPPAAWELIAREETSPGAVMGKHVAPLAFMLALCGWLGAMLDAGFVLDRETIILQPVAAVFRFVIALAGVAVLARLANMFAPRFGGAPDAMRATQLSGYGATGLLLGGVGLLLSGIAPYIVACGGIFSMVLIYIGAPRMMSVPEEKRIGYFWSVIGAFLALVVAVTFAYGAGMEALREATVHVKFGQTEAAPEEAPAPAMARGAVLDAATMKRLGESVDARISPIDPAALEGFLPQSLPGGFVRTSFTATPGSVAQAEGVYTRGEARMVVTITHLGVRGAALVTSAAQDALAVRQNTAGYARHQVTDGRLVAEDVTDTSVAYSIIGRGLAVSIAGSGGVTMDDARAAVETIGMARLEESFR